MSLIRKINEILQKIAKFLTFLGGLMLIVMMLITTADVILRTFFGSTIQGASVIVRNLLIVAMFLGLPYVTFTKGHTRSEVIYARGSARVKMILDILAYGIGAVLFFLMSYSLIGPVMKAFATNQFDSEGTFMMSLAPFYVLSLFGAIFSLYAALYNFVVMLMDAVRNRKGAEQK